MLYQQQATAMQQQHQRQPRFEPHRAWSTDEPQLPQAYPGPWADLRVHPNTQKPYSGVEQLLMAAMIEGNYPNHSGFSNPLMQQQRNHIQSDVPLSPIPVQQHSLPNATMQPHQQPNHHHHLQPHFFSCNSNPIPQFRDYPPPMGRGLAYRPEGLHPMYQANHVPIPANSSELELYKLLERANLLPYFATFLHFGGDDLRQLNEADEDEFMEIMELVGMHKKPLHVRRLQRALENWRREHKERRTLAEEELFKRPSVATSMMSLVNRCSSPTDSRPSECTNLTVDNSRPPTPRSNSSQSFLILSEDQPMNESGKSPTNNDENPTAEKEHQPNVLVNAPKRLRLFNPGKNSSIE